MTDSFVVSSGGYVNGGSNPVTYSNTFQKVISFPFPFWPYAKQAKDSNFKGSFVGIALAAIVINIIMLILMYNGYKHLTMGMQGYASASGPASKNILRFSSPNQNQAMTSGVHGSLRHLYGKDNKSRVQHQQSDTFLSGQGPPRFNDVPEYILRKENRMQDALATYSNLRSNGEDVPDWAEYWNKWQSDKNYSYSGRGMYDTNGQGKPLLGAENRGKYTDGMSSERLAASVY
jgi:hypothetical protein